MANELPQGFTLDSVASEVPKGFKLDESDSDEDVVKRYLELQESHGGIGQQIKTGLEGAASAATFGLSTGLETALGVNPEDIRKRREANPGSHMTGQAAGLVGTGLIPGLGEANAAKAMEGAGRIGASAVGLGAERAAFRAGEEALKAGLKAGLEGKALNASVAAAKEAALVAGEFTTAGKIGSKAVASALENAAFQGGDEISKMLSSPDRSAEAVQSALVNVGLSGLIGGGVGGGIGAVSSMWKLGPASKVAGLIDDFKRGAVEATEGAPVSNESVLAGLQKLKPNAKEIIKAGEDIGAPVLEGQISASKHIQDVDSMVSQSPTIPAIARQQKIQQGMQAVETAVKGTLEDAAPMTEAELGNKLKSGLLKKLEAEKEVVDQMHNVVKESTPHIEVSNQQKGQIRKNLMSLEGYKFKNLGMRKVVDSVLENLSVINSVDDIKRIATSINNEFRMTAPHEVGVVVEKLRNLEQASIERAADLLVKETKDPALREQVMSLKSNISETRARYKNFREDMSELGAVVGKKKFRGPQDFIDFIEEATPEVLAKKLFAKNNSEFLQNLSKKYPDEMALLVQKQKSNLLANATKDGTVDGQKILKEVFDDKKFSPEVRKLMFSDAELGKLKSAKTWMDSLPKNINPSGTSKSEAYRRFYKDGFLGLGAASVANVKDYSLIKMMEHLVGNKADEAALQNSVFPAIAESVAKGETSPSALKSAVNYAMSVVKGEKEIATGAAALFKGAREVLPSKAVEPTAKEREQLDKKISEYEKNPEKLLDMGGETGHYMPNHASAMSETAGRVMQYVSSVKPRPIKPSPLDEEIEPSREQEQEYAQVLNIAEKPLYILQKIKNGTLIENDVIALRSMYPGLHEKFSQAISNEIIDFTKDGAPVPYNVKQSLSLFMGQSLDSSLSPMAIQAAQMSFMKNQAPQMGQPVKKDVNKLEKTSGRFQTAEQSSQARQIQGKS